MGKAATGRDPLSGLSKVVDATIRAVRWEYRIASSAKQRCFAYEPARRSVLSCQTRAEPKDRCRKQAVTRQIAAVIRS